MAIYHLSVKPISRKGGRSATAAAAYRSAEKIHDLTSDQIFDYTRKRGVEHAEIVLSTEAAKHDINWARDRQALWNAAEASETRSNSRVAREYELALPHELNRAQRVELVRAFSKDIADRYQVAVDFAIHKPHRNGDERNHHAHVLTTTRVVEPGGLGDKAQLEWSDTNRRKAELVSGREEIEGIRARWAELTNEFLKEQQLEVRVDHRSLEAQGIERAPQSHLGPAVSGMERRGIETEVGKRISLEMASKRLEQAAEQGRLERERHQVERSLLEISTDLTAAKRERDMQRQTPTLERKSTDLEQLRAEGRAQWLQYREEQRAKEAAKEKEPEPGRIATPERRPTLEEERRLAAERWLQYRAMTPEQRQEHDRAQAQERGQEAGHERSHGLEGPEID